MEHEEAKLARINEKLLKEGVCDEGSPLAEFVLVMIKNHKSEQQVVDEVMELTGSEADIAGCIRWVFEHVEGQPVVPRSESEHEERPQSTGRSMLKQINDQLSQPDVLYKTRRDHKPDKRRLVAGRDGFKENKRSQIQSIFDRIDPNPIYKKSETALCKYNDRCANSDCTFAHSSPASEPGTGLVLKDEMCKYGRGCEDASCVLGHPSPAKGTSPDFRNPAEPCKYFPKCTNPKCPYLHAPTPACKYGSSCKNSGCVFTHKQPTICRFSPCLNPNCSFKHALGQHGKFQHKTWNRQFAVGESEDIEKVSTGVA